MKKEYGPVVPGNVQNRLVSPDGENLAALPTHLEVPELVGWLEKLARLFPGGPARMKDDSPLPYFSSAHQALNIAACDARPLVLLIANSERTKEALEKLANPLAWSPEFSGRFHFVHSPSSSATLSEIEGLDSPVEEGLYIISPEQFGMKGRLLHRLDRGDSRDHVFSGGRSALLAYADGYERKTLVEKFQLHTEVGARDWFYAQA